MAYVVKWLRPTGELDQSEPHSCPSDALRFSRSLEPLRPVAIWAEDDQGRQFRITAGTPAADR